MSFGVYLHVPWCRHRCPYCDFAIAVVKEDAVPHRRYLETVLAELAHRAPAFAGRRLDTIYVGGGTPSLWATECLAEALAAIAGAFSAELGALAEVTLEANPTDCTADRLAAWRAAGVTRLSIGVQATRAADLATLGRDHRMGDGVAALRAALAAGFRSLSADVILGTPQSREPLAALDELAALGAPHLSVYELTIEERTPLARAIARGEVVPEREERLAELYRAAHERLTAAGYEHYEVSSYARPGHRAVHNSGYWTGGEWLGLGNGAASQRRAGEGVVRTSNHRSLGRYLAAAPGAWEAERDELSAADRAADAIWLGMRTADGVPEEAFSGREAVLEGLVRDRLAEPGDGRIKPTLLGFLYADQVARRVLGA